MKCSECGEEKELTLHGTCWKCHLGSVSLNTHIINRVPSGNRFKDYVPEGHTVTMPDRHATDKQKDAWRNFSARSKFNVGRHNHGE